MRVCPKCKSSDYNNRYFTLLINECGHSLCKNCVDTLFVRNSAPCPVCGKTLKKNSFWEQLFDDPLVEKEVYFRKKLKKIFNLHEDDFDNLKGYNNYLEEFETVVFNLVHDVDLDETKKKVEEFQKQNEDKIVRNKNRKTKDELWIHRNLEEEKRFRTRLNIYKEEDSAKLASAPAVDAKALIEELKESSEPAAFIVNNKQRQVRQLEQKERQGETLKQRTAKRSLMSMDIDEAHLGVSGGPGPEGKPFQYAPPVIHLNGPAVPDRAQLGPLGFLAHIRAAGPAQLAGGYHETFGCYRALLESASDLFFL